MSLTDAWSVGSGPIPHPDCLVSSHKPPIPLQTSSETSLSEATNQRQNLTSLQGGSFFKLCFVLEGRCSFLQVKATQI